MVSIIFLSTVFRSLSNKSINKTPQTDCNLTPPRSQSNDTTETDKENFTALDDPFTTLCDDGIMNKGNIISSLIKVVMHQILERFIFVFIIKQLGISVGGGHCLSSKRVPHSIY